MFEAQTKPLIKYYEEAGLLRIVDADADVDTVFKSIEHAVAKPAESALAAGQPAAATFLADLLPPPAREGGRIALSHRQVP